MQNILSIKYFKVGHCKQCEALSIKNGKWRNIEFPSLSVLIEHRKHGYVLFDVGYSKKFFDVTVTFPNKLYPIVTPVTFSDKDELPNQLNEIGIGVDDIKTVMLSHLHADHVSGIGNFKNAKILLSRDCYNYNVSKNKIMAVANGFIPELLDDLNIESLFYIEDLSRVQLPSSLKPFEYGYDLFGDQSLIAIDLPGHAKGQFGLFIQADEKVFLVADAAWSSAAIRDYNPPSLLTFLFHYNKREYYETFAKLHKLYLANSSIKIVPSHCNELWSKHVR